MTTRLIKKILRWVVILQGVPLLVGLLSLLTPTTTFSTAYWGGMLVNLVFALILAGCVFLIWLFSDDGL